MKTLLLARHGKAEKAEFGSYDFKRKLVDRGKADVQRVAEIVLTKVTSKKEMPKNLD